MTQEEFSYCIGRPWYPEDPHSSICVYAYGKTVWHGTLERAKDTLKFIQERAGEEHEYFIYRLQKIDENSHQTPEVSPEAKETNH